MQISCIIWITQVFCVWKNMEKKWYYPQDIIWSNKIIHNFSTSRKALKNNAFSIKSVENTCVYGTIRLAWNSKNQTYGCTQGTIQIKYKKSLAIDFFYKNKYAKTMNKANKRWKCYIEHNNNNLWKKC